MKRDFDRTVEACINVFKKNDYEYNKNGFLEPDREQEMIDFTKLYVKSSISALLKIKNDKLIEGFSEKEAEEEGFKRLKIILQFFSSFEENRIARRREEMILEENR
jgi:hypothetical protein